MYESEITYHKYTTADFRSICKGVQGYAKLRIALPRQQRERAKSQ